MCMEMKGTEVKNRINFVLYFTVDHANPNGDPLCENLPRTDYDGYGEVSDVCFKRKSRNRTQEILEEPGKLFVQADNRCDDGMNTLKERAEKAGFDKIKDQREYRKKACERWFDVRAFGQVFAFKDEKKDDSKEKGLSVGVSGPVTIRWIKSVDKVEIRSNQITKSVNGNTPKEGAEKSSDTMGMKHFVEFGLYKVEGTINARLAKKTGLTMEDVEIIKESLRTLFLNDESAARPAGSMRVVNLYWFEHNTIDGQYPSWQVHQSVDAKLKEGIESPKSLDDYEFIFNPLPDLKYEVIQGW